MINNKDLILFKGKVFADSRGWFSESYNKQNFKEMGIIVDFVQDNHSFSAKKGTLRGLHFQLAPKAQSKLVRCTRGAILDIAVDLRKGSDTYKKWWSYTLSATNQYQLFIPKGFGHGFVTLADDTEVQYKVDEHYSREFDRNIRYDDPELSIDWGVNHPILSEKDMAAPRLVDSDVNFSISVLITGAGGQLGLDILNRLRALKMNGIGVDIQDFDITDPVSTHDYIVKIRPDVIVHCAAYTAVDQAEVDKDLCTKINVIGTGNIARACKEINAKMIYISTDYVFNGGGNLPHAETEALEPLNHYGKSKALGESVVRDMLKKYFIIRTSWVYGKNGNNFVKTMLNLAGNHDKVRVVNDQVGSPTYTVDLAHLICDMMQTTNYGTYHATNEGSCNWAQFAESIFQLNGNQVEVEPIATADYPSKATRPLNSLLAKGNLDNNGFSRLPDWQNALQRFLKELEREDS